MSSPGRAGEFGHPFGKDQIMIQISSYIYPCPACGFTVFAHPYGSSSETCAVCGWVEDLAQLAQPDFTVGANIGSLREAQHANLATYPIDVKEAGSFKRDPRWRPLAPAEYPAADAAAPASPVCYLTTPDPETFVPYWLLPPPADDYDT